jgi:hypothetical protein
MVTRKLREDGDERGMIVYGYALHSPVRVVRSDRWCEVTCL